MSSLKKILLIFVSCLFFRGFEYLVLKMDQTKLGENFIHKILGIGIGLAFIVPIIGMEYLLLFVNGHNPSIQFYISGFSLTDSLVKNASILFFALCILFNVINVVMEEGVFRGLFIKIAKEKYSFGKANLIAAIFFGLWHFIMPFRSYLEGDMNAITMIIMIFVYAILSGMMSIKWGWFLNMTGVLWVGIGEHFLNNTLSNMIHIETSTGVDEYQPIRIIVAQLISFIVIMVVYKKWKKRVDNKNDGIS